MPIKNPQTPKIILFSSKDIVVQSGKQYLDITDKANEHHKISAKRQELWGLFTNARDSEPFMLVYETYNNVQYVADAKPITEDLLKIAIQDMGLKLADIQSIERVRSQSIAYAKDLDCANRIDHKDLFTEAQMIYEFIRDIKKSEV
jgi:hypothetical protein